MPCYDPVGPKFERYHLEEGSKAARILCKLLPHLKKIPSDELGYELICDILKWQVEHEKFDAMTEGEQLNYIMNEWKKA